MNGAANASNKESSTGARKSGFLASAVALLWLAPGSAFAGGSQPSAWVSGSGVNATTCGSTSSPCRTFQYAYNNVVAPGGTIYVRDAADYSPIKITHAISIINDSGGTATIVAVSGYAILVQAVGAFHLKGLTLDGAGEGANGVNFTGGGSLTIENCTIKGFAGRAFTGNGILINPAAGTTQLTVTDSVVSGNASAGILVDPSKSGAGSGATAQVFGTLTRVDAVNNETGVLLNGSNNSGGAVSVIASEVNASDNIDVGFEADLHATLFLSRSTATGNGLYGVANFGTVDTYGDNAINGNRTGNDVIGGLTSVGSR